MAKIHIAASLALLVVPPAAMSQSAPPAYHCRFVPVPVRDGIHLNTSVCQPDGQQGPLPFLLTRTPYGIEGDTVVPESYRFFAADGYIFVSQDIRGRYKSEGQFIMNRPLHDPGDPKEVDESTDTYDTVQWLLANVPGNNGRVGVLGVSYPGFLATMAGINPHPAVRAISPQAPMTDTWMGDDFFHQGAFRLSYGFEYAGSMELTTDSPLSGAMRSTPGTPTTGTPVWALANVDRMYFHGRVPTWQAFLAHPAYDRFWQQRAVQRILKAPLVPTLDRGRLVGSGRPLRAAGYLCRARAGRQQQAELSVMGPWNHGGWRARPTSCGLLTRAPMRPTCVMLRLHGSRIT